MFSGINVLHFNWNFGDSCCRQVPGRCVSELLWSAGKTSSSHKKDIDWKCSRCGRYVKRKDHKDMAINQTKLSYFTAIPHSCAMIAGNSVCACYKKARRNTHCVQEFYIVCLLCPFLYYVCIIFIIWRVYFSRNNITVIVWLRVGLKNNSGCWFLFSIVPLYLHF